MQHRHLIPELMDDPELSESQHLPALRGLRRINRWVGNSRIAWSPIRRLCQSLPQKQVSVLDLATGSGDIALDVARRAALAGISIRVEGWDISQRAVAEAERNLKAWRLNTDLAEVHFLQKDVLNDPIRETYDVVMCTTFLHHLTDAQASTLLSRMLDAARYRVVVVDLLRGRTNTWLVWLASHTLTRSKIVHADGPQSARAAFSLAEVQQLAEEARIPVYQLRAQWPCRFLLVGSRDS